MMRQTTIHQPSDGLINWQRYNATSNLLGQHFIRILGYFREDGAEAVLDVERAVQDGSSADIIVPAHRLKGMAAEFGADTLAILAEEIEVMARHYVETRQDPSELLPEIAGLKPLFEKSICALEQKSGPPNRSRPVSFRPH